MEKTKPTILTFTSRYLPGCMCGGPIRSIASLVEILGDEFNFRIVCIDRDFGSKEQYPEIKVNKWQRVGKGEVFYISPGKTTFIFLRRLINNTDHDVLYLNSWYSYRSTIIPLILRRLGLIKNNNTIIAPRGEFSPGALKLRSFKKSVYNYLAKTINLSKNAIWQASSSYEREDICAIFQKGYRSAAPISIIIAPNLSIPRQVSDKKDTIRKKPGTLKVVCVSRISPMKNLDGALRMLNGLSGEITFNIFGPLEDMDYWKKCQRIINKLPSNIQVHYKGITSHDEVVDVMAQHELFYLPTHGENYGHVIIEALVAGCPVLISDQTPWRGLDKEGVGWDLSLDQPEKFIAILQKYVDMESSEMELFSKRAREYGMKKAASAEIVQKNRDLFNGKYNLQEH